MRIMLGKLLPEFRSGHKTKPSSKMLLFLWSAAAAAAHVYKANHRQKARELNGRHKRDAKIGLGLRLQLQLRLNGLKCRGKDAARAAVNRGRGKREGREGKGTAPLAKYQ